MATCRACYRSRDIAAALAVPGASMRELSRTFKIPRTTLKRHVEEHMGRVASIAPTIVHSLASQPLVLPGAPQVRGDAFDFEPERALTACLICVSVDRRDIELAISRGALYSSIAKAHDLEADIVGRHARQHVPSLLAVSGDNQAQKTPDEKPQTALQRAVAAADAARQLMEDAAADADIRSRATAMMAVSKSIETLARLNGELDFDASKLLESPQFQAVIAQLMKALAPFREARAAALAVLTGPK